LFGVLDASGDEYTVVLLQGSGTYAVEAAFSTSVPRQGAKVVEIFI
jgi:aspartate aminotransferase-like enzyme